MIQKANSLEIKKKCIIFYQNIWLDDLDKQLDIQYFLDSDIFYIEFEKKIIASIEVFKKDKKNDFYKNRYDFKSIETINDNDYIFLSRLATLEEYRKK